MMQLHTLFSALKHSVDPKDPWREVFSKYVTDEKHSGGEEDCSEVQRIYTYVTALLRDVREGPLDRLYEERAQRLCQRLLSTGKDSSPVFLSVSKIFSASLALAKSVDEDSRAKLKLFLLEAVSHEARLWFCEHLLETIDPWHLNSEELFQLLWATLQIDPEGGLFERFRDKFPSTFIFNSVELSSLELILAMGCESAVKLVRRGDALEFSDDGSSSLSSGYLSILSSCEGLLKEEAPENRDFQETLDILSMRSENLLFCSLRQLTNSKTGERTLLPTLEKLITLGNLEPREIDKLSSAGPLFCALIRVFKDIHPKKTGEAIYNWVEKALKHEGKRIPWVYNAAKPICLSADRTSLLLFFLEEKFLKMSDLYPGSSYTYGQLTLLLSYTDIAKELAHREVYLLEEAERNFTKAVKYFRSNALAPIIGLLLETGQIYFDSSSIEHQHELQHLMRNGLRPIADALIADEVRPFEETDSRISISEIACLDDSSLDDLDSSVISRLSTVTRSPTFSFSMGSFSLDDSFLEERSTGPAIYRSYKYSKDFLHFVPWEYKRNIGSLESSEILPSLLRDFSLSWKRMYGSKNLSRVGRLYATIFHTHFLSQVHYWHQTRSSRPIELETLKLFNKLLMVLSSCDEDWQAYILLKLFAERQNLEQLSRQLPQWIFRSQLRAKEHQVDGLYTISEYEEDVHAWAQIILWYIKGQAFIHHCYEKALQREVPFEKLVDIYLALVGKDLGLTNIECVCPEDGLAILRASYGDEYSDFDQARRLLLHEFHTRLDPVNLIERAAFQLAQGALKHKDQENYVYAWFERDYFRHKEKYIYDSQTEELLEFVSSEQVLLNVKIHLDFYLTYYYEIERIDKSLDAFDCALSRLKRSPSVNRMHIAGTLYRYAVYLEGESRLEYVQLINFIGDDTDFEKIEKLTQGRILQKIRDQLQRKKDEAEGELVRSLHNLEDWGVKREILEKTHFPDSLEHEEILQSYITAWEKSIMESVRQRYGLSEILLHFFEAHGIIEPSR